MEAIYKMLSVTQPPPAPEVVAKQYRPASVVDKAHINGRYAFTHISILFVYTFLKKIQFIHNSLCMEQHYIITLLGNLVSESEVYHPAHTGAHCLVS